MALINLASPAFGATGPTLKCTRVGQQIVWRGKKYTCVKSGKKLVWDKGISIATPSPSNTPSSSPSPSPSKSAYSGTKLGVSSDITIGETKILAEPDPFGRGSKFVVTRTSKGLVAYSDICTHEGCSVEVLTKNQLQCPCHGAQYDAITGEATRRPAYQALREYRVQEINGEIIIWIY